MSYTRKIMRLELSDAEDFNNLLRGLGEDAFQTAYLPSEDDEGMVM